ncbi:hypothetical protein F7G05_29130, partial [Escherichia coli]
VHRHQAPVPVEMPLYVILFPVSFLHLPVLAGQSQQFGLKLAAREQADDDIARADKERDEALANVAALESELAVLREVVAER